MSKSEVVFAAMKEAVEGPSGKNLVKKFRVSSIRENLERIRVVKQNSFDILY